jgi:hypothetical protein
MAYRSDRDARLPRTCPTIALGLSAWLGLASLSGCGGSEPVPPPASGTTVGTSAVQPPLEKTRPGAPKGQPDMSPRELRDFKRKAQSNP